VCRRGGGRRGILNKRTLCPLGGWADWERERARANSYGELCTGQGAIKRKNSVMEIVFIAKDDGRYRGRLKSTAVHVH